LSVSRLFVKTNTCAAISGAIPPSDGFQLLFVRVHHKSAGEAAERSLKKFLE
jgi:hypothetical protein